MAIALTMVIICSALAITRQISHHYTLVAIGICQISCGQRLGCIGEAKKEEGGPSLVITPYLFLDFSHSSFYYWLLTFKVKNWRNE